jgi:hypothetical protein
LFRAVKPDIAYNLATVPHLGIAYRSGIGFGTPLGEDRVDRDGVSTPERAKESFIDNKEITLK